MDPRAIHKEIEAAKSPEQRAADRDLNKAIKIANRRRDDAAMRAQAAYAKKLREIDARYQEAKAAAHEAHRAAEMAAFGF